MQSNRWKRGSTRPGSWSSGTVARPGYNPELGSRTWDGMERSVRVSFCRFLHSSAVVLVFPWLILGAFGATHRSPRETTPPMGSASKLLLDVFKVRADGDPAQALVRPVPGPEETYTCDVVVIGGGMGGVSAALTAANSGLSVCLTEPTLWLGGQMTSEGVSAFDENKWIETTGATATYAELRRRIIELYQTRYGKPSTQSSMVDPHSRLNPGNCWVSYLCFQPSAGLEALQSMLQPAIASGKLQIWLHTVPTGVQSKGRSIQSVQAYDFSNQRLLRQYLPRKLTCRSMPSRTWTR